MIATFGVFVILLGTVIFAILTFNLYRRAFPPTLTYMVENAEKIAQHEQYRHEAEQLGTKYIPAAFKARQESGFLFVASLFGILVNTIAMYSILSSSSATCSGVFLFQNTIFTPQDTIVCLTIL